MCNHKWLGVLKTFLLVYITCTGRFIVTFFCICLQYTLVRFTPSITFPQPLQPVLKPISTSFIVLFSYKHKNTLTIFTLSIHIPPPTSIYSLTEPVLCSCPSVFKCIFVVQSYFLKSMVLYHLISFSISVL
jgi:hypothetical protein